MGSKLPPLEANITLLNRELRRGLIKLVIAFTITMVLATAVAVGTYAVLKHYGLSTEWTGDGFLPGFLVSLALMFPIFTKYWRFRFRTLDAMQRIKRSITVPDSVDDTAHPAE